MGSEERRNLWIDGFSFFAAAGHILPRRAEADKALRRMQTGRLRLRRAAAAENAVLRTKLLHHAYSPISQSVRRAAGERRAETKKARMHRISSMTPRQDRKYYMHAPGKSQVFRSNFHKNKRSYERGILQLPQPAAILRQTVNLHRRSSAGFFQHPGLLNHSSSFNSTFQAQILSE